MSALRSSPLIGRRRLLLVCLSGLVLLTTWGLAADRHRPWHPPARAVPHGASRSRVPRSTPPPVDFGARGSSRVPGDTRDLNGARVAEGAGGRDLAIRASDHPREVSPVFLASGHTTRGVVMRGADDT